MRRLTTALDTASVPYMFAGSMASTFHGTPRATQDIDLVVSISRSSLKNLLLQLPDDAYYVSQSAATEALLRGGQFNVIDLETGWKADLIVKKRRPFSDAEFRRRVKATIASVDTWVASAEDTVIAKLEWAERSGGSERQLRDVRGILGRGGELDLLYIEQWVSALGLERLWAMARAQ